MEATSSHTIKQHASYQLKGQLPATTMSIKSMVTLDWICSETWPCSLPNMHLAEPLTPHTVSRSTNRKLRHCEFTWVHLNQKIALGHSNAPGGLGGGRIKVYCQVRQKLYLQRGWTLHLYKYSHYKTTVNVCNLIRQSSLWSPNGLKALLIDAF